MLPTRHNSSHSKMFLVEDHSDLFYLCQITLQGVHGSSVKESIWNGEAKILDWRSTNLTVHTVCCAVTKVIIIITFLIRKYHWKNYNQVFFPSPPHALAFWGCIPSWGKGLARSAIATVSDDTATLA